jgi:precorrin-2/cobalt-factor-2 C20-methyltransferase
MKLFCVGCGPGDPELLTIKAVRTIENAEILFAPTSRDGKASIALSVVQKHIRESARVVSLVFPMIRDRDSLKDKWKKNAGLIADAVKTGKRVVYLTVGDPSLYSTWIYIHRELASTYDDIEVEIVPGITSIFAFAAQAKLSLAEGHETVAIVPACYDLEKVRQTADCCDTLIFLKDGRYFEKVVEMLSKAGFPNDSILAIAQDISVGGEIIRKEKLKDLIGVKGPVEKYFSIMVAKKDGQHRR